jgi:hypothetical protein
MAAEQQTDFLRQLGAGKVGYVRAFDHTGIAKLIPGAVAERGEVVFILFGADGELLSFYHDVAHAMTDAGESDLLIAAVH